MDLIGTAVAGYSHQQVDLLHPSGQWNTAI